MYIEGWLLNQAGDWIFFDGSVLSGRLLPYQKVLQSQSKTPQHSQRRFYTRLASSNPFVLIYPQPVPQIPTTNGLSSLFVPFSTLHRPDVVCKPTPSFKLNLTVSICSTACDSAPSQRTIFVQPQYVIRADVLKRPFQDFVRRRSWHWVGSNFPPWTFWRSREKAKLGFKAKKLQSEGWKRMAHDQQTWRQWAGFVTFSPQSCYFPGACKKGVCLPNLTNFTPFSSLQMISKRGQSVRKYGWHGTAPRGRCEKVKNENSIICLVIVINIIVTLMIIINFIVNFIVVFVDFFQLKILASSHRPSCEWSRCLPEVFPVATLWWFRQTCTAGSEDHVFCVCFADFFVILCHWQISTQ